MKQQIVYLKSLSNKGYYLYSNTFSFLSLLIKVTHKWETLMNFRFCAGKINYRCFTFLLTHHLGLNLLSQFSQQGAEMQSWASVGEARKSPS